MSGWETFPLVGGRDQKAEGTSSPVSIPVGSGSNRPVYCDLHSCDTFPLKKKSMGISPSVSMATSPQDVA